MTGSPGSRPRLASACSPQVEHLVNLGGRYLLASPAPGDGLRSVRLLPITHEQRSARRSPGGGRQIDSCLVEGLALKVLAGDSGPVLFEFVPQTFTLADQTAGGPSVVVGQSDLSRTYHGWRHRRGSSYTVAQ